MPKEIPMKYTGRSLGVYYRRPMLYAIEDRKKKTVDFL